VVPVSPVLHARAALLPLARRHDVSSLSSPCHLPTVTTGPRDGSRSTRRSRAEGPERRTQPPSPPAPAPPRTRNPPVTAVEKNRGIFGSPGRFGTLSGTKLSAGARSSTRNRRPGPHYAGAGPGTAYTIHHHPQPPPRHQHDHDGPASGPDQRTPATTTDYRRGRARGRRRQEAGRTLPAAALAGASGNVLSLMVKQARRHHIVRPK